MVRQELVPGSTHREVMLDQDFSLFSPSPVFLNLHEASSDQDIERRFHVSPSQIQVPIKKGFVPFAPTMGVEIASDEPETVSILSQSDMKALGQDAPDQLIVACSLWTNGQDSKKVLDLGRFSGEINMIHLQVEFPQIIEGGRISGGKFESWATPMPQKQLGFFFDIFYSVSTGPLIGTDKNGLPIFLPTDKEKLELIKARFVMHSALLPTVIAKC